MENWEPARRRTIRCWPTSTAAGGREHLGRQSLQGAGLGVRCSSRNATSRDPGAPQLRRLIVATVVAHVMATADRRGDRGLRACTCRAALGRSSLCISFGLAAALVLRRQLHSHHSWVRCRLAAEFCRSALATWGLPRAAPCCRTSTWSARGPDPARSLRILHARSSAAKPVPIEEFKRDLPAPSASTTSSPTIARQVHRALPLYRRLTAAFWIATVLALACVAIYAVTLPRTRSARLADRRPHSSSCRSPCRCGRGLTISIISINDLQRRVARYQDMRALLEASRAKIASCRTWNSLEHVVLKTERALLQEVIEWHSLGASASRIEARAMNTPYKYRAFISYSHRDEKWARWLHRSLETYRAAPAPGRPGHRVRAGPGAVRAGLPRPRRARDRDGPRLHADRARSSSRPARSSSAPRRRRSRAGSTRRSWLSSASGASSRIFGLIVDGRARRIARSRDQANWNVSRRR